MRRRGLASWLLATDCREPSELKALHAIEQRVEYSEVLAGEDGVATAVLDMWACIGADFFVGTRGSMYTDYIERFRVAQGKVVDHLFFELESGDATAAEAKEAAKALEAKAEAVEARAAAGAATAAAAATAEEAAPPPPPIPPPTAPASASDETLARGSTSDETPARGSTSDETPFRDSASVAAAEGVAAATVSAAASVAAASVAAPSLAEVLALREQRSRRAAEERSATLATAAAGGSARAGAVLGLMAQRLPPALRAKVLAFHPQAAAMPPTICRSSKELFDDFVAEQTPPLRKIPLRVAPRGSSDRVALLIEPRAHYALEHVVRNAMLFLNGPRARGAKDARREAAPETAPEMAPETAPEMAPETAPEMAPETAPAWQLQIFHGTSNLEHIRAAFTPTELEHVQLVSLKVDYLSNLSHNEHASAHHDAPIHFPTGGQPVQPVAQ